MGERAVAYVRSLGISDEQAERVFLLLAQRTQYDDPKDSRDTPMGILLNAVDVPRFAAHLGLLSEEFCQQLRGLKQLVRMDVLEHRDGSWEIVYGPSYTDHAPRAPARRPSPTRTSAESTPSSCPAGTSTALGAATR